MYSHVVLHPSRVALALRTLRDATFGHRVCILDVCANYDEPRQEIDTAALLAALPNLQQVRIDAARVVDLLAGLESSGAGRSIRQVTLRSIVWPTCDKAMGNPIEDV